MLAACWLRLHRLILQASLLVAGCMIAAAWPRLHPLILQACLLLSGCMYASFGLHPHHLIRLVSLLLAGHAACQLHANEPRAAEITSCCPLHPVQS